MEKEGRRREQGGRRRRKINIGLIVVTVAGHQVLLVPLTTVNIKQIFYK